MRKQIAAGLVVVSLALGGTGVGIYSWLASSENIAAALSGCTTTTSALPGTVPAPYDRIFTAAASYYKIDPALEAAIFMSEHGNTWPAAGSAQATSPKGAMGWFQFIPSTWAGYADSNPNNRNGDPQNLTDSAYAAAHYLFDLGGKPNMPPGNPNAPEKGTVAWVAGAYNGGTPLIGDPENDPYRANAVARYKEFSGGSSTTTTVSALPELSGGSVYVLGDSIALGAQQQLQDALGRTYESVYINASKGRSIVAKGTTPGNETSGLEAISADAQNSRGITDASVIIIELGTNSLHGGDAFEGQMERLIGRIRNPELKINAQAKIYWVEVFSGGTVDKTSLNTSIQKEAQSLNFGLVQTDDGGITTGSDNIHPTTDGNNALAQTIASQVSGQDAPSLCGGSGGNSAANIGAGTAEKVTYDGRRGWVVRLPGTNLDCDYRIIDDVEAIMRQGFTVTACYAPSGHRAGGEHPLGLAIDAVPTNGDWSKALELAHTFGWKESCETNGCASQMPPPFRFIGYNGYPGHGDPAHAGSDAHIHLSWMHTEPATPGTPVPWVYVF
jgi:hypothetical protein